jgi:hypothetical protein
MIKKETLKAYIDGVQHQYECDDLMCDALKFVHSDNYNITMVSEEYTSGMDAVMEEYLGHVAHDYLSWWMWETNVGIGKIVLGVDPHIFVDDDLVHNLDSFDKLYDYLTTLNDELI